MGIPGDQYVLFFFSPISFSCLFFFFFFFLLWSFFGHIMIVLFSIIYIYAGPRSAVGSAPDS